MASVYNETHKKLPRSLQSEMGEFLSVVSI